MEPTRKVARGLAREGKVEILQKGKRVADIDNFKGPIRLRLCKSDDDVAGVEDVQGVSGKTMKTNC